MMGPTIVFTIPVALGIIEKEDRAFLAQGVLAGMVTIPLGVLVGGLVAGFDPAMVLANLIPIVLAAILIAVGLWRIPEKMTTGFLWFGKGLVALISLGLVVAVFEYMTGAQIMPDGWELAPPTDGLVIIGSIGMMLLGAFPAVYLIITFAEKPLTRLGRSIGINDKAAGGMIATLANNIPMFQILKEMDPRGKVLNVAFAVSAAFTFGDHLGFTAGVQRQMIFPMIVGKLTAGITAVVVAYLFFRKTYPAHREDVPSEGTGTTRAPAPLAPQTEGTPLTGTSDIPSRHVAEPGARHDGEPARRAAARARERGLVFLRDGVVVAGRASPASEVGAGAAPARPAPGDPAGPPDAGAPTSAVDRAAVRRAVVATLGRVPSELDAVLDRVLGGGPGQAADR